MRIHIRASTDAVLSGGEFSTYRKSDGGCVIASPSRNSVRTILISLAGAWRDEVGKACPIRGAACQYPLLAYSFASIDVFRGGIICSSGCEGAAHAAIELTVHNEIEEYGYQGAADLVDRISESISAPVELDEEGFLMRPPTDQESEVGKLPTTLTIFVIGETPAV